MGAWDAMLQLVLLAVLAATLLHVVRLQRALGGLRADRGALNDAVAGFDGGTRQAEAAIVRMQALSQELAAHHRRAEGLRDDLAYLSERGEGVADRLDAAVRGARGLEPAAGAAAVAPSARSRAERNLVVALQQGRR